MKFKWLLYVFLGLSISVVFTVCCENTESVAGLEGHSKRLFRDAIVEVVLHEELLATQLKDYLPSRNHHIVVVTPSYKNADWYKRNLASIFAQDYKNFSLVYVDDASPDNTGDLVRQYIKKHKQEDRSILIVNKKNQGAMANLYNVIVALPPETIVVTLDGDDWFAQPHVLSLINKIYNKYDVLMTYGSYQRYPYQGKRALHCRQLPAAVIETNSFRSYPKWVTSHLRSFKAGLFQRIKKDDLLYEGKFVTRSYDLACMFPMLEMAGHRSMFINDILYIYNYATPLNDAKIARKEQKKLGRYIRAKKPYDPLAFGVAY